MWHSYYCVSAYYWHFYSHIPCGMWRNPDSTRIIKGLFLLTHPVWDVTQAICEHLILFRISTHTSRVGCDDKGQWHITNGQNFYSHIPCGMWLRSRFSVCMPAWISTHTSRVGCDKDITGISLTVKDFYSHIPCGMWRKLTANLGQNPLISTHTSRVGCDQPHTKLHEND